MNAIAVRLVFFLSAVLLSCKRHRYRVEYATGWTCWTIGYD